MIEEWHRALREGCRLQLSQAESIETLKRMMAALSIAAVRLLELRDMVDQSAACEKPKALQQRIPEPWIRAVAALAKIHPETLTPRMFWRTIAKRGGWLERKGDGRLRWKAIWSGWHDVQQYVTGAEVMAKALQKENTLTRCG